MKIYKTLFILIFCLSSSCFAEYFLKTGIYSLKGSNTESGVINYSGKVIIESSGELYNLVWLIGNSQAQVGTAILEGDVLSVTYYDLNGKNFGVVSYHIVSENKLEGKWTPFRDSGYGREFLEFESYDY